MPSSKSQILNNIQIKDAPLFSIQATFIRLNSVLSITLKMHSYVTFLKAHTDMTNLVY